ncbi:lactate/malate family dehydrogenase [Cellulosimicrobium protaetiae]|uniref:Lactate dehydrogenase n=1 Tax=Cellulosimicrobium protaetiae TaxID=2587808 RepID=A0A6M5UC25_9MICO|nr:lactate dehydrogenase [Cellulosimicrobium protaetiae]QJW35122.1 lactate dehydrogenase [Cellulosimicrobium protaetiae]
MDVAVVGATGDVGRQVCTQIVERRVLPPTARLQLVGRAGGASGRAVHGLRADLVDAYDEHAPLLDVAHSPEDVTADVIVVAAGLTPPARTGADPDRRVLAATNGAVLAEYADAIARHGSGHEVVVVVTNPVELGVAVMAERLGRHRVLGMGAWLDTLRFRRELAVELGVRRHRVGGFVGGQHGEDAVPLWSTVRVSGLDADERARAVAALRRGRTLDALPDEIASAKTELARVAAEDMGAAFDLIDTWPADLRLVTRPWMTHQSGAKTPAGTASATVDLLEVILDGREIVVAGQVALDGELGGRLAGPTGGRGAPDGGPFRGVLGVPVVLGPGGWTRVLLDDLPDDEARRLTDAADGVGRMVAASTAPADDARSAGGERAGTGAPAPGASTATGDRAPSGRGGAETAWVATVHGLDQPGTLTALTGVFSTRGVSFDSLATEAVDDDGRAGRIVVTFRATPRRARALERAVRRLATVHAVVVDPAPHPEFSQGSTTG